MNAAAPSPAALRPRAAVWPWLLLAAAIIAVDQLTKAYFDAALEYGERIAVLPVFDFTLLYNRGAAFSFLAQQSGWQRWLFTGLGTAAACFILWMLHRHRGERRFSLSLAMILGGALGNVIDRALHGYVVDFLDFHWGGRHFPAFNIADSAITVGAALLILDELLRVRRSR